MTKIRFAINRTCLPHRDLAAFLDLAQKSGVEAVEIRNDIAGQEFANGMPASELKARLADAGVTVASVNALQRFNDWNADRAAEAKSLIRFAAELGAPGLVLCPAHQPTDDWSEADKQRKLVEGLSHLKPIFAGEGVTGYVEPLGMTHSTMKMQAKAVAAVDEIDGWDNFALCYDTFQFYRCGDDKLFINRVGLIHVSGIARPDLSPGELTEPDRGLVLANDRVGNIEQLKQAFAAGYDGYVSMEPFNEETQTDPDLTEKLTQSFALIRASL